MVVHNNILAGASGATGVSGDTYQISKSLRFNSSDSAYLKKNFSSAGDTTTWTLSFWIKRATLGGTKNIFMSYNGSSIAEADYANIYFDTSDRLVVAYAYAAYKTTDRKFRDVSAWYHIVVRLETGNSTASDRVQIYVNGVKETSFANTHDPELNESLAWNKAHDHRLGSELNQFYNDCYLAEVHFVDGQALAPTDFGEFDSNNVWQPKEFTHGTAKHTGDWIGDTTGTPYSAPTGSSKAFDGDDSTGAAPATSTAFEFTPSTPITGISKVRIRAYRDPSQSDDDGLQLNGTDIGSNWTAGAAVSEVEFTVNNLTSLRWETNSISHWYKIYKIEIYYDGAYHTLVPGDINSFHLDFSDNSSNAALGKNSAVDDDFTSTVGALTTTQAVDFYYVGSYPPGNLFDGSLSTFVYGGYDSSSTNSDLVWTPNGSYSASSSLRVHAGYYSTIYVNGVSKATGGQSSAGAWVTLSHTGPITSIKFENTSNGNVVLAGAIEVDGTVVVTTAWTVNNLTGSVSNPSYDSTHGSNITSTEAAKIFDSDDSTYGVATGNFVGFAYGGSSVKMKVENTSSGQVSFYIQPNVSNNAVNSGTWGSQSAGTVSNNQWYIPANTTATATFTFPATWDGDGRIYTSGNESSLRFYSMDAAAGDLAGIDSLLDTPTNYTATGSGNNGGNYCTLNPLALYNATLGNGNLEWTLSSTSYGAACPATIAMSSGKYYCEMIPGNNTQLVVGIIRSDFGGTYSLYVGNSHYGSNTYSYYQADGSKYVGGSSSSYGASYAEGDVIGIAYDGDNNTITFYKNGASQGAINITPDSYHFAVSWGAGSAGGTPAIMNFGQRPFAYTPPTGYKSLCTTNLPDPTIADGSTAFDAKTFTANNGSQSISLGFSPDLVWTKSRANAYEGQIFDIVRGNNQELSPNATRADRTLANSLTFDSSGFTMPSNNNNANYGSGGSVAWAWDAGTSNTSISVGGLNSSVYDQSQTWSDLVTGTLETSYGNSSATAPFDGDTGSSYPDGIRPTNGNYLSMNFGTTFANATSVTIYGFVSLDGVTYPGSEENLKINGTAIGASEWGSGSGQSSHTFSLSNGLTSLEWGYSSGSQSTGYVYLSGIEVDGKLLVDAINDSQTWSNSLTALSGSLTNPSNAFDTDESSYADSTAGFTLDLSGHTFGTGAHTIEVKSGGATSFSVNGSTSIPDPGGGGAKVWTGTHTGELTSLVSSATGASLYYIKIDGKYLANPGQNFVTNFPSIASTVRARPETGFSIVSYTGNGTNGATVGHKLNSKPGLILLKTRGDTQNWMVYHSALGATKAVFLSTTDSANTNSIYFNNTEPTSSVFSLGTRAGINQNSDPMIAYCFAPVEGYSAFGGPYSGTGSASTGAFQYCGFKPRLLMIKRTDSSTSGNWIMLDSARSPHNVVNDPIYANDSAAEYADKHDIVDFLSNGFKIKAAGNDGNNSGGSFIWAAWAESPFKTSRAS